MDSIDNPQAVKVYLKTSKTDQLGREMDVYISKTDCSLCPLTAVMHYMTIQALKDGPFLFLRMPLTKSAFTARIQEALQILYFPEENFAGYSFCIGAATIGTSAGIEDSVIRIMERWSSSTFLSYICTPREHS